MNEVSVEEMLVYLKTKGVTSLGVSATVMVDVRVSVAANENQYEKRQDGESWQSDIEVTCNDLMVDAEREIGALPSGHISLPRDRARHRRTGTPDGTSD